MDDPRAAQADEARAVFASIEQRVRNDQMLSDEGKRERIAAARESTNKKIEALQQESVAAKAAELKKLETMLCSPPPILSAATTPADKIARDASYRDALDRARRTDPQKPTALMELLEQAERTSDRLQSRAAMVVALERDNLDVINRWVEANPAYEKDVQRLYDISGNSRYELRDRIAENFKWTKV